MVRTTCSKPSIGTWSHIHHATLTECCWAHGPYSGLIKISSKPIYNNNNIHVDVMHGHIDDMQKNVETLGSMCQVHDFRTIMHQ